MSKDLFAFLIDNENNLIKVDDRGYVEVVHKDLFKENLNRGNEIAYIKVTKQGRYGVSCMYVLYEEADFSIAMEEFNDAAESIGEGYPEEELKIFMRFNEDRGEFFTPYMDDDEYLFKAALITQTAAYVNKELANVLGKWTTEDVSQAIIASELNRQKTL